MKYMLMLIRDDEQWEAYSDADMPAVGAWFMDLAGRGRLLGGEQLFPARTATTVSWPEPGRPVVTDGPYLETKETIGGFGIIDVGDLDEAIAIARSWPARAHRVELRPCVERPG